ncbi:UDP-N-acetylmuramate dehydrogenase [Clostridium grantii]|uniref:UDP-N-acetylenolpyruvoylglucosamine reductase n=1 Tax=Clostridium grantii DSM 8605 TaxID=1121316 RepID=A0A1M5U5W0_9CLOT|nr:UDP-N-acetylmuramate dehydrogenase [Clostridium grantii]SHH58280.1 UDP-N-acetylmuramate dehydrogenase [Clostridium grantii DSM 8605]
MHLNKRFMEEVYKIFPQNNVKLDELMKKHTSFKVGGPADCLVIPKNYDQIAEIIKLCIAYNEPCFIMGNGSNLLVRDGGIRGVVVKLTELKEIKVENNKIIVQCGALLTNVSMAALNAELKDFEFACGIPGTIGGAVAMNAGAYNGEIANVIESATVVDKEGNILKLSKQQLELGYRTSIILKKGYTVLQATFSLQKGNYKEIKEIIDDLMNKRVTKQPLEFASAGSTFKRPEGYFAGKLIEDSGLKGKCFGDAQVSVKHSGFIINKGNAKAQDILNLINHVQNTVKQNYGVDLKTEVRIIGEE